MKTPTGNIVVLCILPPFTTEHIKEVISREEGIHRVRQQITFEGKVLEDGHSLDEYNIDYESTLDLVVRQGSKHLK